MIFEIVFVRAENQTKRDMIEKMIEMFKAPYIESPLEIKCGQTKRRERRAKKRKVSLCDF